MFRAGKGMRVHTLCDSSSQSLGMSTPACRIDTHTHSTADNLLPVVHFRGSAVEHPCPVWLLQPALSTDTPTRQETTPCLWYIHGYAGASSSCMASLAFVVNRHTRSIDADHVHVVHPWVYWSIKGPHGLSSLCV